MHRFDFNDDHARDQVNSPKNSVIEAAGNYTVHHGQLEFTYDGSWLSLKGEIFESEITSVSFEMWVSSSPKVLNSDSVLIEFGEMSFFKPSSTFILLKTPMLAIKSMGSNFEEENYVSFVNTTVDFKNSVHVVLSMSLHSKAELHIDGKLAWSSPVNYSYIPKVNYLTLGSDSKHTKSFMGSIDEFRIWKYRLSSDDVETHFFMGPGTLSLNACEAVVRFQWFQTSHHKCLHLFSIFQTGFAVQVGILTARNFHVKMCQQVKYFSPSLLVDICEIN